MSKEGEEKAMNSSALYKHKVNNGEKLFYLIYSAVLVLFCYGFSPLIQFYSTDSAVFYSIGKAMDKGMVVYKDFFDHKGMWIYFFNCFGAYLNQFFPGLGMYLVELLFSFINLVAIDRLMAQFTKSSIPRRISACLFFALSLNYFSYSGGNLTETYALSFQLISCYYICKYYLSGQIEHPAGYMFIHGLASGICFLLRPNLVAMWIPFGVALAFRLFLHRKTACFFKNFAALILGVALAFTPPLIYCVVNDCLQEMVFCTFTFNLSYVNSRGSMQNLLRVIFLSGNSIVTYLSLLGVMIALRSKRVSRELKTLFSFAFLFVTTVTFMGLRAYGHYFQTLLPFTIPLFVWSSEKLEDFTNHKAPSKVVICLAVLFCTAATLVGNLRLAIRYLPVDTEYKHLYGILKQTSHYIDSDPEKDSFLSTMNLMQAYVVTDTIPSIRYPYIPGVEYERFPDPIDQMCNEIMSGNHKYIFGCDYIDGEWLIFNNYIRGYRGEINRYIREYYRVAFLDETYHYVLFEKKEM